MNLQLSCFTAFIIIANIICVTIHFLSLIIMYYLFTASIYLFKASAFI